MDSSPAIDNLPPYEHCIDEKTSEVQYPAFTHQRESLDTVVEGFQEERKGVEHIRQVGGSFDSYQYCSLPTDQLTYDNTERARISLFQRVIAIDHVIATNYRALQLLPINICRCELRGHLYTIPSTPDAIDEVIRFINNTSLLSGLQSAAIIDWSKPLRWYEEVSSFWCDCQIRETSRCSSIRNEFFGQLESQMTGLPQLLQNASIHDPDAASYWRFLLDRWSRLEDLLCCPEMYDLCNSSLHKYYADGSYDSYRDIMPLHNPSLVFDTLGRAPIFNGTYPPMSHFEEPQPWPLIRPYSPPIQWHEGTSTEKSRKRGCSKWFGILFASWFVMVLLISALTTIHAWAWHLPQPPYTKAASIYFTQTVVIQFFALIMIPAPDKDAERSIRWSLTTVRVLGLIETAIGPALYNFVDPRFAWLAMYLAQLSLIFHLLARAVVDSPSKETTDDHIERNSIHDP